MDKKSGEERRFKVSIWIAGVGRTGFSMLEVLLRFAILDGTSKPGFVGWHLSMSVYVSGRTL